MPRMAFRSILPLLLLAGCVDQESTSNTEQALGGATDCLVPGALPDDGLDDRVAIQQALTNKGCALLSPGTYDVGVTVPRVFGGTTGLDRYDLLKLAGGRSLRGSGPATTIRFYGDAGKSDLRGVGMTGDENLVSDMRLDTTGLSNTGEQTHAIHMTGPALKQKVSGVWFQHPSLGPSAGGDCIKIVGYDPAVLADGTSGPDKRVSAVIIGNIFGACDRSGIAAHSGIREAVITSNLFLATGDQDIDLEGGGGIIDNLVIDGNAMRRTLNSGISVAIGADMTRKAVFSNNSVHGGRISTYNVQYLSVIGNTFESPGNALQMIKMSRLVTITGNTFVGTDPTITGTVITASHHNSGKPGNLVISGNTFELVSTNGGVVSLISAASASFTGNSVVWTPTTPVDISVALQIYGITQPTEAILVSSNVIRGPYSRTLGVTNSYEASNGGGIRSVTFVGNILRGPLLGVHCSQAGLGPYVSYGNSGATHQCAGPFTAGN